MAENKTQKNDGDVDAFLASVEHQTRREDAQRVCAIMREVTGSEPSMWGDSIVGFGEYHYRYATGREGEYFRVGLSPRKQNLTLYFMVGFEGLDDLLDRLGPHKTTVSCLHITRLDRVDEDVLAELIRRSWESAAMGEAAEESA